MNAVSTEGVLKQLQRPRSGKNFVRVNIVVPSALRKEWKAMALAADKTLTDFVIEAMQHQINRTKQTEISTQ